MTRRPTGKSARQPAGRAWGKRWADLSQRQRGVILALVGIEFALTSAAAVDLWFRPQSEVRGRKALWWPGIFVQPAGPILYLLLGRHPDGADAARSRPAPAPSPTAQHAVTRHP